MKRQILNIEVEFRTLLGGVKEPVLARTLPDTADSNYYKISNAKRLRRMYFESECVGVIPCTIAMHGKPRDAFLLFYPEKSKWKLVI